MQEVLVELWLKDGAVVVAVDVLIDRDAELRRVRLKNMSEVTGLGLGRYALAGRTVPGETGPGVQRWLHHPIQMVFLDSGSDSSLQPLLMLLLLLAIQLVVDLKSQIGEKGWLRSGEVLNISNQLTHLYVRRTWCR